jgi:hypothetical protein
MPTHAIVAHIYLHSDCLTYFQSACSLPLPFPASHNYTCSEWKTDRISISVSLCSISLSDINHTKPKIQFSRLNNRCWNTISSYSGDWKVYDNLLTAITTSFCDSVSRKLKIAIWCDVLHKLNWNLDNLYELALTLGIRSWRLCKDWIVGSVYWIHTWSVRRWSFFRSDWPQWAELIRLR